MESRVLRLGQGGHLLAEQPSEGRLRRDGSSHSSPTHPSQSPKHADATAAAAAAAAAAASPTAQPAGSATPVQTGALLGQKGRTASQQRLKAIVEHDASDAEEGDAGVEPRVIHSQDSDAIVDVASSLLNPGPDGARVLPAVAGSAVVLTVAWRL